MSLKMSHDQFPSSDDPRVENSPMRHQYRVLTDAEKAQMAEIKDRGAELWDMIDNLHVSRETSIAKIKIEEAVMWAVKHITS